MSGMYYNNPYVNSFAAQNLQQMPMQYGVDTTGEDISAMSSLANAIPVVGPLLGFGMNMVGQAMQNSKQEEFYNKYMSPQARMAQMRAAGINPNAAAQGISGSSAPQMNAAAPTGAFSSLGEALGNSVNTALTADAIKAGINKTNAETDLTDSLNIEKQTTNRYLDAMQQATLNKLVQDGSISKSFANMAAVDESYKPAMAEQSYNLLLNQVEQVRVGVDKLNAEIIHEYAATYQAMAAASLSEAQIHKVFSDIGVNNAMINKISHEVSEIDARTASTYQGITESQARTDLMNIQKGFESKYLDIFKATGYDVNKGINSNFMSMCADGRIGEATTLLNNLDAYMAAEGSGRSHGKDYKWQNVWNALGVYAKLLGK